MTWYDVHGAATVEAPGSLPLPETLRVDGGDDPDVTVEVGEVAYDRGDRERYGHRFFWDDRMRSLVVDWTGGVRAELRDLAGSATLRVSDRFRRTGDMRFLLRSVLAQRLNLADGTFAYGAGLRSPGGEGVYLLGWNEVGKSSTAFRLVSDHGWEFLGDDKLVVRDGDLYSYGAIVGVSPGTTLPDGVLTPRERAERRIRALAGRLPLEDHLSLYPDQKLYLPPERILPEDRILGAGEAVGLDRIYLLTPDDPPAEIGPIETDETVRRAALCNHLKGPAAPSWHPLVELACFLDGRLDRETLTDAHEATVRSTMAGAETREIRGSKREYADAIAADAE